MPKRSSAETAPITLAVTGSGGSGAVTAGSILLAAAAHAGHYGLLMRSAGPQIRGGESVSILRFGTRPISCIGDRVDLLAALDWGNFERFSDELPIDGDSLILSDPDAGPVPPSVAASSAEHCAIAFSASARARPDGRTNMVAVGALGAEAGLPLAALLSGAADALADKGDDVVDAARACIRAGHSERQAKTAPRLSPAAPGRWRLSGNAAAGLGALRGGVRFVAAYPITPASEMLEWLAPQMERIGGTLLQAEDELAAVNMLIGASFGGTPALTATSGPGLSLMTEGIGLAVASETPIIVVDVARGGPSTGLPTKSEQADLDQALYGLHGEAPHLVLAPLSISDCVHTLEWSTRLAERLQTAAIVLSDQALGQTQAIIDPPARCEAVAPRKCVPVAGCQTSRGEDCSSANPDIEQPPAQKIARYAETPDGISPMPLPGQPACVYTADGLEHDTRGIPSTRATDHAAQLDKRLRKLAGFDYGDAWAEIEGAKIDGAGHDGAAVCIVTWGSSWGAVHEAATRLRTRGIAIRVVALRLLAPLRRDALVAAIGGARVLVVEINHSGQLFRYLHAERALPANARSFARPGPLPLRPREVVAAVLELTGVSQTGQALDRPSLHAAAQRRMGSGPR